MGTLREWPGGRGYREGWGGGTGVCFADTKGSILRKHLTWFVSYYLR